jgi:hypothetical protein
MGEVFSEAYTFYQATSEFRFDTSGYGRPSGSGFNAMVDFSF